MRAAFLCYLIQAWTAGPVPAGPASSTGPGRQPGLPFPALPVRLSRPRPPGRGGAPPAHRTRRQPTTSTLPLRHAVVHDTPSGTGATLVPAIQADGRWRRRTVLVRLPVVGAAGRDFRPWLRAECRATLAAYIDPDSGDQQAMAKGAWS
jgi:hypothetical protein